MVSWSKREGKDIGDEDLVDDSVFKREDIGDVVEDLADGSVESRREGRHW